MTPRFLEAIADRVVLGDGAMGTELLARGAAWDHSSSEVNLGRPGLVAAIHADYVRAGAELLRTNTFTANGLRIGDADRLHATIREGVRLAREAAGPTRFVAGSVGPLSDLKATEAARSATYREQCGLLAEQGCDALLLETFLDGGDLSLAVAAARPTGLPLVVQAAVPIPGLDRLEADLVGLNCIRPDAMEPAFGSFRARPFSAFPSAGSPDRAGKYPLTPALFGEMTSRLLAFGVRLLGGCCGTTPSHLLAVRR